MKNEYILLNLKESKESLDELIKNIIENEDYDFGEYLVEMQHIYWHINRAWNGREFDIEKNKLTKIIDNEFIQFPKDLAL
jgi:hypothetical protein